MDLLRNLSTSSEMYPELIALIKRCEQQRGCSAECIPCHVWDVFQIALLSTEVQLVLNGGADEVHGFVPVYTTRQGSQVPVGITRTIRRLTERNYMPEFIHDHLVQSAYGFPVKMDHVSQVMLDCITNSEDQIHYSTLQAMSVSQNEETLSHPAQSTNDLSAQPRHIPSSPRVSTSGRPLPMSVTNWNSQGIPGQTDSTTRPTLEESPESTRTAHPQPTNRDDTPRASSRRRNPPPPLEVPHWRLTGMQIEQPDRSSNGEVANPLEEAEDNKDSGAYSATPLRSKGRKKELVVEEDNGGPRKRIRWAGPESEEEPSPTPFLRNEGNYVLTNSPQPISLSAKTPRTSIGRRESYPEDGNLLE